MEAVGLGEGQATLDARLRREAPGVDPAAMERARARAELALFGVAPPPRIQRYEILEPIGGGGMGSVYRAYDPQLDRCVALKVLHPRHCHGATSRARPTQEAKALALLDHQNVVKVHDVLVHQGQLAIVMELAEGETLAAWQQREPRTWREIVRAYLQAGDGLAAAHALGLVHRDFKPSNAVLGADGRVRVLDFGLARFADASDPRSPAAAARDPQLTGTGAVVGTLRYAAPEQLAGSPVSAAADQFGFCVALHGALEGVAPFEGTTAPTLLASIRSGARCYGPDRAVPRWLRRVIARGLSAAPSDRFPSMGALLVELRRPRGWPRWRAPMVAAVATASIVALTWKLGASAAPEPCDGGASEVAEVWGPPQRARIERALAAVETPYARSVWPRARAALDRYAAAWRDTHVAACRQHRAGASSSRMLDRQMTCLEQRLGDLSASIGVLGRAERSSASQVMDVVARMPEAEACSDPGDIDPPAPVLAEVVRGVRAQISQAEALARDGQIGEARAAAAAARARAIATPYPPVEVEAALAEGRIALFWGRDLRGAVAPLARAKRLAFERGMYAAAVEAAARLLYAEHMDDPVAARLEQAISDLVPLSASLRGGHFVRALLLNNIGTAYMALERRADAKLYFQQALVARGSRGARELELTAIDRGLAIATADDEARDRLLAEVWDRLRTALGDDHPAALDALYTHAGYTLDPAVALARLSRVAEAYAQHHRAALPKPVAASARQRAVLAAELGDPRAAALYGLAIEAAASSSDPDVRQWHHLNQGELALLSRDPERAIRELAAVRDRWRTSKHWWQRAQALRAEVGLGRAEVLRGRDDAAARYFEAAIADYAPILAHTYLVYYRRDLARAQSELAAILRRSKRDLARATRLARGAAGLDRAAPPQAHAGRLE
jgi:tetratricopeptide (TPR) repeat protein